MHADGDLPEHDWAEQLWPDDGPDADWPDDSAEPQPSGSRHPPPMTGVPSSGGTPAPGRPRRSRIAALALTATVALGAGAGAVLVYKNVLAQSAPGAAASPASSATAPGGSGGGSVGMMLLGRVLAVGGGRITVGGGPIPAVSAQVTSATRFTGSARSLAAVRVGDSVAVQITQSDGVVMVVSLRDPAS